MLKLHFGVKPAKLDAPDQFKGRGVGNHVLAHGFSVSETALQREVFIDRRPAGNIMRGSDNLQTCSHGKCRDEAQIGARGGGYISTMGDRMPDIFEHLPVKRIGASQLRLGLGQSRLRRRSLAASAAVE